MGDRRSDTPERILDAAIEAASVHGIARLNVGDVAGRAGVSRPTLYKYFPSKDALVAAAVAREADVMVRAVTSAASGSDDPRQALEEGLLAALRIARDHPLLDRVVRTEPETLVPLLVADGGPVLMLIRGAVEAILVARVPDLDALALRRFADVVARLVISYAVSAPDDPPEVVAAAVARILVDGAVHAGPLTTAITPSPRAPSAPAVPSESDR